MDTATIRKNFRQTLLVSASGLLVPIAASYPLAVLFNTPDYATTSIGILGLFLGIVLAISALPVLARILAERNLLSTNMGVRNKV